MFQSYDVHVVVEAVKLARIQFAVEKWACSNLNHYFEGNTAHLYGKVTFATEHSATEAHRALEELVQRIEPTARVHTRWREPGGIEEFGATGAEYGVT
jgi:hypothetical protein